MTPPDEEKIPFWLSNRRPGATPADLDLAEKFVGHRLPPSLRELLLAHNGGVSNYTAYVREGRYYPMLPIFGVDPEAAAGTLMTAFRVRHAFGVPEGVVPFAGQGHSWWGLDYRSDNDTPGIVFRLDEEREIETVASSFKELLEGLIEEE